MSQKNFNKQGFSHKNDAQNKGFSSQNRGFLPAIKNHKAQNKTHDMVTADSPLLGLGIQDALSETSKLIFQCQICHKFGHMANR